MRHMAGWMGVLWLVVGCTVPGVGELPGTCQSNADCTGGALCDVSAGICYAPGSEPEQPGACSPACADYQACTASGCRPRFTGLNLLSQSNGAVVGGAPVEVVAELLVDPTYASTQLPPELSFSATVNGSDVGSFGAVSRDGARYKVIWTPPATAAQVILRAAHPTPAVGLSAEATVTVDPVPPTFTLVFSSPPNRDVGTSTQADLRDTALGFERSFRRDETVTVTVSANEPVSNVTLTVIGIGPDDRPGQELPAMALTSAATCPGGFAFCGSTPVDLSKPEMRIFRGTLRFRVEGQDAAGNQGLASGEVKVSRWKWAFDAAGVIPSPPAIGARGTLYVSTSPSGGGARVLAIDPGGARKWEFPVGNAAGNLAVGAFTSNDEFVYAAVSGSGGTGLYALRGSNGSLVYSCVYSSGTLQGAALAVGTTSPLGTPEETAVGVVTGNNSNSLLMIRPFVASNSGKCQFSSVGTTWTSLEGGSMVLKDQSLFYATLGNNVVSFDLAAVSSTPRTGWPQSVGQAAARDLAWVEGRIYGGAGSFAGTGALFSLSEQGGASTVIYPSAYDASIYRMAIGSGNIAYFGAETSSSQELVALAVGTANAAPQKAFGAEVLAGTPVIGRNDRLYTLSRTGKVAAWTASSLMSQWDLSLGQNLTRNVSPTLDCQRDAGGNAATGSSLGTLYVPGETRLYAFIVDSPGLDTNAPWPKHQRDVRNTGNPATPVTNCP